MQSILDQIAARRKALALKQKDMAARLGMSRQQYQRLESRGNPRLDTLELVSRGLNSDFVLVPRDRLPAVLAALEHDGGRRLPGEAGSSGRSLVDDPWQGLPGGLDDEPAPESD
jgi:transcriptional regulator with XRE-family HTH domain